MKRLDILAITALVFAIALPDAALAQAYKWRDDKGQIVYSDQPPPKGIPPGKYNVSIWQESFGNYGGKETHPIEIKAGAATEMGELKFKPKAK